MKKPLLIHGLWLAACVGAWFAGRISVGEPGAAGANSANAGNHKNGGAPDGLRPVKPDPLKPTADAILAAPEFAGKSIPEVFRAILTERDGAVREPKFMALLSKLKAADAMAVQQVFLDNDKVSRWFIPEYHAFMQRWGQVDGPAAAKFTLETRKSSDNSDIVQRLMTGWASASPQDAVDWINANESAPDWMEGAAMKGLVTGLASKNVDLAAKLVRDHLDSPSGQGVVPTLIDHFIQASGIAKAAEWYDSAPGTGEFETAKAIAYKTLYDRYRRGGDETFEQTAAFVQKNAGSAWCDVNTVLEMTRIYHEKNPEKAAKWVESLPPGSGRELAFKVLHGEQ